MCDGNGGRETDELGVEREEHQVEEYRRWLGGEGGGEKEAAGGAAAKYERQKEERNEVKSGTSLHHFKPC